MTDMVNLLNGILGGWREPIPQRFWQFFREKPFNSCGICFQPLLLPHKRYFIHKYYVQSELQEEIAMCLDCRNKVSQHYSKQSKEAIKKIYAKEKINERVRLVSQLSPSGDRSAILTANCFLCGNNKNHSPTYVEYAYCEGEDLVYYAYPLMICELCAQNIHVNLSSETRELWQRFFEEHFGFPPTNPINAERTYRNLEYVIF